MRKSTYRPLSILVVDNASTDNSVCNLKKLLPADNLIELSVNGGYPYGNNVGIEHAFCRGAQYVLITNNDIIVDRDCIKYLYQAISHDKTIGIIGPKVLYYSRPDTINYAGIKGCIGRARYKRIGLNETDNGQYEGLVDTLYQDGCALLLSKSCYEKIGGFDEWLWTSGEDLDLCARAILAGFRVCCQQKAKVWHKISATLGDYHSKPHHTYYMERNKYIVHRRYGGSWLNRLLVILILLSCMPRILAHIALRVKTSKLKNLYMLLAATLVGITTKKKRPSDVFAPIKAVKRKSTFANAQVT
ncbi:MAG: hypothetical protein AMJ43_07200 [Coxiella sp. DG_40]|nr:MAG: hypothetical protein AMJ43_07200 [Coxiella sp. DG_40]